MTDHAQDRSTQFCNQDLQTLPTNQTNGAISGHGSKLESGKLEKFLFLKSKIRRKTHSLWCTDVAAASQKIARNISELSYLPPLKFCTALGSSWTVLFQDRHFAMTVHTGIADLEHCPSAEFNVHILLAHIEQYAALDCLPQQKRRVVATGWNVQAWQGCM